MIVRRSLRSVLMSSISSRRCGTGCCRLSVMSRRQCGGSRSPSLMIGCDRWVAEFDIVGFFDNLRHARLLREVAKVVDDVEVIGLIRRWLTAGVLTEAGLVARHTGTPQGAVISALLANIYLHRLDVEVRTAGFRLIRHADDFVILADRRWKVEAADRLVRAGESRVGRHRTGSRRGEVRHREDQQRVRVLGILHLRGVLSTTTPSVDRVQGQGQSSDPAQSALLACTDHRRPQPAATRMGRLFRPWQRHQSLRRPGQVDQDAAAVTSPQAVAQPRVSRMRTRTSGSDGGLVIARSGAYPLRMTRPAGQGGPGPSAGEERLHKTAIAMGAGLAATALLGRPSCRSDGPAPNTSPTRSTR